MKINSIDYSVEDIIKAAKLGVSISRQDISKNEIVVHPQCIEAADFNANILFKIEGVMTLIATPGKPCQEYKLLSKHMLKKTHAVMVDTNIVHPYTQKPFQKRRY